MSWIADAHRDWHTAHGQNVVCPLDCGVGEDQDYEHEPMTEEEEIELQAWRARQEAMDSTDDPAPWEVAPF